MIDRILAEAAGDITPDLQNLIGGEWRAASEGTWIEVNDPAGEGACVARVPNMSATDVAEAWDAAATGGVTWAEMRPIARAKILASAAARIRELRDPIARVV